MAISSVHLHLLLSAGADGTEWEICTSRSTGKEFYYNKSTQESVYERYLPFYHKPFQSHLRHALDAKLSDHATPLVSTWSLSGRQVWMEET